MSIYEIELENGHKLYLNVDDSFSEYRLFTFLICLELGKIVAMNKLPCLASVSDSLISPGPEFQKLILSARENNPAKVASGVN